MEFSSLPTTVLPPAVGEQNRGHSSAGIPVHGTDFRFSIESCVCREKTVYSSTMGGRLPECLANLFIVNFRLGPWLRGCAYRCRRTIAIAAIMPKGIRMKSAMRMPIAKPFASGERPGGTATNRVSQSSSFMVPSELRIQYTDIAAVTD
jgi:hypothetical protein